MEERMATNLARPSNGNNATTQSSIPFSVALNQSLRLLCTAFRVDLTEEHVQAYSIGLRDLSGAQIVRATEHLLRHHREFLPTPGQVRDAVVISSPERKMKAAEDDEEPNIQEREQIQHMLHELGVKLGVRK